MSAVLPLSGCSCDPSPYLGVTSEGAPAIGWRSDGDEQVVGARLVEADGTTVWEVVSEGAPPMVIVVGEALEGFTTVVPLDGEPELSGRELRVTYLRDGTTAEDSWPFLDSPYEPSSQLAEVKGLNCGAGLGRLGLDIGGGLGIATAGVAGASLLVFLVVGVAHALGSRRGARPDDR